MYTEQHTWHKAEDDLRQSLQRCEMLDLPWEVGNTLYYLGLLYRRRAANYSDEEGNRRNADLGRARYNFEQALGYFESLHAEPAAERVRLMLVQGGVTRV
jgi:hypothetical protein